MTATAAIDDQRMVRARQRIVVTVEYRQHSPTLSVASRATEADTASGQGSRVASVADLG